MDALLEADSLTESDLEDVTPCGGITHPLGANGHVESEPGSFALVAPCCGLRVIICASRRTWICAGRTGGCLSCTRCDRQWLVEQFRIVPI